MADLRRFLPRWQEVETATPGPHEPMAQISGDIPVELVPLEGPSASASTDPPDHQAYEVPLPGISSEPNAS